MGDSRDALFPRQLESPTRKEFQETFVQRESQSLCTYVVRHLSSDLRTKEKFLSRGRDGRNKELIGRHQMRLSLHIRQQEKSCLNNVFHRDKCTVKGFVCKEKSRSSNSHRRFKSIHEASSEGPRV